MDSISLKRFYSFPSLWPSEVQHHLGVTSFLLLILFLCLPTTSGSSSVESEAEMFPGIRPGRLEHTRPFVFVKLSSSPYFLFFMSVFPQTPALIIQSDTVGVAVIVFVCDKEVCVKVFYSQSSSVQKKNQPSSSFFLEPCEIKQFWEDCNRSSLCIGLKKKKKRDKFHYFIINYSVQVSCPLIEFIKRNPTKAQTYIQTYVL